MSQKRPRIARFEVIRSLGRGLQGSVFLVHDPKLDRNVALKVLHGGDDGTTGVVHGIPVEARAAARLKHPNVISIHEIGEHQGFPYLVFEFVEGETVAARVARDGPMDTAQAWSMVDAILAGVSHAHGQGVIHLDLSPNNVLIDSDGTPKIMDFGLARTADSAVPTPQTAVGTVRYMAPERFDLGPLTPAADVFALGAIIYELLAGEPAFAGDDLEQVMTRIRSTAIDLSPFDESHDKRQLCTLFLQSMAADPDRRYRDATALHKAWGELTGGSATNVAATATADDASTPSGSIEFIIRRLQRKKDFPSLSSTVVAINRLTANDGNGDVDKLSNVLLRDYGLAQKVLRLANSAFYRTLAGEVTTVSQAVRMLGFDTIRHAANGMAVVGIAGDRIDDPQVVDRLLRSFLAGLLARHFAQRAKLPAPEEAFLCGMLQDLGETVMVVYFPEEHAEVAALSTQHGLDRRAAAGSVLGCTYEDIGVAVAALWELPQSIVLAAAGLPDGQPAPPEDDIERLRDLSVFANELTNAWALVGAQAFESAVKKCLQRFNESLTLSREQAEVLLPPSLEKLGDYARVVGLDTSGSEFLRRLADFAGTEMTSERDDPPADAARATAGA